MKTRTARHFLFTAVALLALLATACGGATETTADGGARDDPPTEEAAAADDAGTAPTPATGEAATAAGAADDAAVSIEDLAPLDEEVTLRLAITKNQVLTIPLWMALGRGWFEQVGLDVVTDVYRGSSNEQIPRMATGEIDMSLATPSPALFNQISEGFGIQVISSLGEEREGRISLAWLTVLADKADEITELEDLEGMRVEGARIGSPPALLVDQTLEEAGLSEDDVELTYRVQAPPDMFALAEAGAADVIGMNEPLATQSAEAGVVEKWRSIADIMPWFQPGLLAVSPEFLEEHPEAVQKFLEVYVAASRQVNAAEGAWTDDIVAVVDESLEGSVEDFSPQGGVPFFSPTGEVSTESLERVQQIYVEDELLEEAIDPGELVAEEPLAAAVEALEEQRP